MKKYLTLAVVLGAIALFSVSYLAKAEQHIPAAAVTHVDAETVAKDAYACHTSAETASEETKIETFKKCMIDKGYTEEAVETSIQIDDGMIVTE